MNDKVYVIPAEGLKVRDPVTLEHIPDEGAFVPQTTYWRRRIKCRDVAIGKAPRPNAGDAKTRKED